MVPVSIFFKARRLHAIGRDVWNDHDRERMDANFFRRNDGWIAALKAGQVPNQAEAIRAKTRSKHNTFIVVPVIFLMISNHFPGTYDWRIVSLLILAGWGAAKFVRKG